MEPEHEPTAARTGSRRGKGVPKGLRLVPQPAPPGLRTRAWVDVPLAHIDAADQRYQFRLGQAPDDLVESMRSQGQRDPVDLCGGRPPYRIVDGFRRVAAAQELGWTTIRGYLHEGLQESDAWRLAFTKNVARRNLSPIERANAVLLARRNAVGLAELPGLFGISERQVRRYVEFAGLPQELLELCDGRVVTMAHAKAIHDARVDNPKTWTDKVQSASLGVRDLQKLLRAEVRKHGVGRRMTFAHVYDDRVRVHAFTLRIDADPKQRMLAIAALKQVLRALQGET
ncbi:MAG: ParB/RepB/Spo0J family partition protein [Planctomycetes bacterium]|nr:ParB/RepB/Spo0J family partition protein [Planctomycetota bacterium]